MFHRNINNLLQNYTASRPEDSRYNLRIYRRENFKSHNVVHCLNRPMCCVVLYCVSFHRIGSPFIGFTLHLHLHTWKRGTILDGTKIRNKSHLSHWRCLSPRNTRLHLQPCTPTNATTCKRTDHQCLNSSTLHPDITTRAQICTFIGKYPFHT
jgi:hypothetical protein